MGAPATEARTIEGRVDAVAAARVYGWAWDRSRPDERLSIELRVIEGGKATTLAAAPADRERADLKANGVGDGRHAFEIPVSDGTDPAALTIVARVPATGEEVVLHAPTPEERVLEQAVLPRLAQLAARQQALGRALAELGERIKPPPEDPRIDGLAADLADARERIAGLEVFLLRIDGTLRDLHGGVAALEGGRGPGPLALALAATGGGIVAGLVMVAARLVY